MAGSLVDLNQPGVQVPPFSVVDSSVVIDWLEATYGMGVAATRVTPGHDRALWFFRSLESHQTRGFVTSISFNEFFHYLVRERFAATIADHLPVLAARFPSIRSPRAYRWQHLLKARSELLRTFVDDVDEIRLRMIASGLTFLQPTDLGPIPSGRSLDEEMLDLMARYELDTGDAAILLEARRAGVTSIVTADADLHRAQADFDVYTWL